MPDVVVNGSHGPLPAWLALPSSPGPWPGVVIIHDAGGATEDLKRQASWLADAGFLAIAPDLYSWGGRFRCLFAVVGDVVRRRGRAFDEVQAARDFIAGRADCTGKVGVIGFCMGGGFALVLAPRKYGFSAASVNYGAVPSDADVLLATACPIVASYGAKDKSLRGAAARLERILTATGTPHDVKEYADAGHSFLNDHDPNSIPLVFRLMSWTVGGAQYHAPSAEDARRRIAAFFETHLA